MKTVQILLAIAIALMASASPAQDRDMPGPPRGDGSGAHEPPEQAYADCRGRRAGDAVQHTTPEGTVAATCVESPKGLVARPLRGGAGGGAGGGGGGGGGGGVGGQRGAGGGQGGAAPSIQSGPSGAAGGVPTPRWQGTNDGGRQYSLDQATSDRAQLNTIAFDGLAFLTGDFGYDTFLPPGKVSDYFGFQYMRDIDAREGGHNTSFLTRIAHNMLAILDEAQKGKLLALAREQQADIRRFAEMRLPLIKAFRLNLEGRLPSGSRGLDRAAVVKYSADLYALDGRLSYQRAKVMAEVLRSLSAAQKAGLSRLRFGDSGTWPEVADPIDRRTMSHDINVAVMTYASEMFSWYAGSLMADTYFCPERHGMYFGGFGMKTAPAMGKRDYAISTTLTGNSGEAFLAALGETQRRQITALVDMQRQDLAAIVQVRREIAAELRRLLGGGTADQARVLALSRRYGELDGNLSYLYATAFARVGQSLTAQQRRALAAMRSDNPSDPKGPFLYSTPIAMPNIANTDMFFGVAR